MTRRLFAILAALLLLCPLARAQETVSLTTTETIKVVNDSLDIPKPSTGRISEFAWGADLGSTIDMTGQDLTAVDLSAYVGYRCNWCRFVGAGAEVKMMVSNSSRCFPVFAMVRSGFSYRPSLLFLEGRFGVSFNNLHNDIYERSLYGMAGIGITLAHGKSFSSHITLSYEIIPLKDKTVNDITYKLKDLHCASIRIGASF